MGELAKKEVKPLSLADALGGLVAGGSGTGTDAVVGLVHNDEDMPIKANLKPRQVRGLTRAQVYVAWCRANGRPKTADVVEAYCKFLYMHSCSEKGKRAEQAFDALKTWLWQEGEEKKRKGGLFGQR